MNKYEANLKYYLALGFEGEPSLNKMHCTVTYLGTKTQGELLDIIHIVNERIKAFPLEKKTVLFNKVEMFGPEKDIRVLRPNTTDLSCFRPDIKERLKHHDASAFRDSFKPHVTTDRKTFNGTINRLVLATGDRVIKSWPVVGSMSYGFSKKAYSF